jgi:hypothetical protein
MLYREIIAVCSEIHTEQSGCTPQQITRPSKMLCHVVTELPIGSVSQSKNNALFEGHICKSVVCALVSGPTAGQALFKV